MEKETIKLLRELTELPGPPGDETRVIAYMKKELGKYADEIIQDRLGSTIGVKYSNASDAPKVMIAGHMDEIAFITSAFAFNPERASLPDPFSEATDVPHSTILTWTPAEGATRHDVYVSRDYDAVNAADRAHPLDVLVSEAQAASSFPPASPPLMNIAST